MKIPITLSLFILSVFGIAIATAGAPSAFGTATSQHFNRGAFIAAIAAVDQCQTNYYNELSVAAPTAFGTGSGISKLDQADANLQANVTANATSSQTLRALSQFNRVFLPYFIQYMHYTYSTGRSGVSVSSPSLNAYRQSLNGCIENVTVQT